ncbi:MAG: SET domain-containing protein-lysine N-methyltransferase [Bacteroidetes bacterium]|nr:SET domain-containing protein-lysine N-methyltransferase [Bacteroidota bacterium]
MIHPNTELKFISTEIGYGVFATTNLPKGTIVYVKDSLEHSVSPTDYLMHSAEMKQVIDKYSYIDENGNRIVSWDFAKYVNHCCNFNTISTGYGFEIAIRDIMAGEQITDEYSLFNLDEPMQVNCGSPTCRKVVSTKDFDDNYQQWDVIIKDAMLNLFEVEQPLMNMIDPDTRSELDGFYADNDTYKSVYRLKRKMNN